MIAVFSVPFTLKNGSPVGVPSEVTKKFWIYCVKLLIFAKIDTHGSAA